MFISSAKYLAIIQALALPISSLPTQFYQPASNYEISQDDFDLYPSMQDPPFPIGIKEKHRILAKANAINAVKEMSGGVVQSIKTVGFCVKQGCLHSREAYHRLQAGQNRKALQQIGQAIIKTIGGIVIIPIPIAIGTGSGIKGSAMATSHKVQQYKAGKYSNSTNHRAEVIAKAKGRRMSLAGRDWSRDFTQKHLRYKQKNYIGAANQMSSLSTASERSIINSKGSSPILLQRDVHSRRSLHLIDHTKSRSIEDYTK